MKWASAALCSPLAQAATAPPARQLAPVPSQLQPARLSESRVSISSTNACAFPVPFISDYVFLRAFLHKLAADRRRPRTAFKAHCVIFDPRCGDARPHHGPPVEGVGETASRQRV